MGATAVAQLLPYQSTDTHIAQSMLFSMILPQISPYGPVSLLNLAQGATRALQWKCAFPHLVAGSALWRMQRHLGQMRMGPLDISRTPRNVHFLQGFIRILMMSEDIIRTLVFTNVFAWFEKACVNRGVYLFKIPCIMMHLAI